MPGRAPACTAGLRATPPAACLWLSVQLAVLYVRHFMCRISVSFGLGEEVVSVLNPTVGNGQVAWEHAPCPARAAAGEPASPLLCLRSTCLHVWPRTLAQMGWLQAATCFSQSQVKKRVSIVLSATAPCRRMRPAPPQLSHLYMDLEGWEPLSLTALACGIELANQEAYEEVRAAGSPTPGLFTQNTERVRAAGRRHGRHLAARGGQRCTQPRLARASIDAGGAQQRRSSGRQPPAHPPGPSPALPRQVESRCAEALRRLGQDPELAATLPQRLAAAGCQEGITEDELRQAVWQRRFGIAFEQSREQLKAQRRMAAAEMYWLGRPPLAAAAQAAEELINLRPRDARFWILLGEVSGAEGLWARMDVDVGCADRV